MTRARPLVVALLMLGVHVQCAGDAPAEHDPLAPGMPGASGPAVLFIGHSLTGANDLPQRVAELSRDAGARALGGGGASSTPALVELTCRVLSARHFLRLHRARRR